MQRFTSPSRTRPLLWWSVLVFISTALAWTLTTLHVPAGVLLACMLAGILLSSREIRLGVPPRLFVLAQGVLGCLMARSLQPSTLARVAGDWPIFLGATVSMIAASAGLGWILMRRQVFPGTTAI
ncbi:MAG: AbrB family transcriptional regulator, partial [Polaromonas sp.]|nr:AbrB family transcriptional regulator [Polaromonas sp.]